MAAGFAQSKKVQKSLPPTASSAATTYHKMLHQGMALSYPTMIQGAFYHSYFFPASMVIKSMGFSFFQLVQFTKYVVLENLVPCHFLDPCLLM